MRKTNLIKKSSILFLATLLMSLFFVGCSDDDDDEYGNWVESSAFNGDSRANSVSFTIGDKGYLVTGYDGDDFLADTWEYNSSENYWIKKADFPGVARSSAVGFSINGKGYLGTGFNSELDEEELKDFWEYDPTTDTWTQKADFGGTARYAAIGFSIGNDGYIGTGYDGSEQKDFWKYDVASNTWEQSVGFSGQKRKDASVFTIDDVAYIGLGIHNNAYEEDFYAFNGNTWTRLTDLDDDEDDDDDYSILLSSGAAFSLDGKGYVTTGIAGSINTNAWEYSPATDTWEELPVFEGSARQNASTFTFDTKAFVLMGRSGNYYFDDVWEFRPYELENEDD
ncbi:MULTISPECIES: kelch repeat-containing protein [Polaribacter]|uniref:Galactose oxidase n=2 Tax=Polaribacter sejongensis TaxID=985043 RepID=A0AAJ1VGM1_9FLAO|nr:MULTISPECIES: kelch repeat-containing protein [Polaribacter]AUC22451.1 galactose oxidase [Polaribacter sejongensis]MDN3619424.1 galactose oxidase [Polaribacter undariae]UWD33376.1 galactose oxidase [Polaribacter undariae]